MAPGQNLFPFGRILGAEDNVGRDFFIACLDRVQLLQSGFPVELHDRNLFGRSGDSNLGENGRLIQHRRSCIRPKTQSPAGILPLTNSIAGS